MLIHFLTALSMNPHYLKINHNCDHQRSYSEQYDSYYCKQCDKWFENKCGEPECEFCKNRPKNPSLMK